jgi:hypothetical protein
MEQKNEGMLHQGLAFRNFKHSFNLADKGGIGAGSRNPRAT